MNSKIQYIVEKYIIKNSLLRQPSSKSYVGFTFESYEEKKCRLCKRKQYSLLSCGSFFSNVVLTEHKLAFAPCSVPQFSRYCSRYGDKIWRLDLSTFHHSALSRAIQDDYIQKLPNGNKRFWTYSLCKPQYSVLLVESTNSYTGVYK